MDKISGARYSMFVNSNRGDWAVNISPSIGKWAACKLPNSLWTSGGVGVRVWAEDEKKMSSRTMKSVEPTENLFSLADFYLAAFLISSGLELIRTERLSPNRVTFVLRDSPRREQFVRDFYSSRAQVNPLKYKDAIVNLKALIHGMQYAR